MKNLKVSLNIFSESEIESIHKNTVRILEKIGIKVPNDECLTMLERVGAIVDRQEQVARIPGPALQTMLDGIKGQNDENVAPIEGHISTQAFIVDYMTKTRRYGLMDDLMKGIALVDKLENFKTSNAVVIPSDVPSDRTDLVSYQKIYTYSKKPGGTYILSPVSAKYIIQMAKLMGRKVGYLLETVSPLRFRKESLEMAMVFTKEGMPLSVAPMVMAMGSGPMTVAGTIVLQNAEVLGSLFTVWALTGMGADYTSGTHSLDIRSLLCSFGSPNQALFGMGIAQLARHYGLLPTNNCGLTDALMPDFQAGFEKASSMIFACLAGTKGIGCQGIVGADMGISLEQLVLDNEWLDAYNYIIRGIEISDETLAADVIERVGIGGNFMAEEHTVEHIHTSYWKSSLFNRDDWDVWIQNGSKDSLAKAHEFVEWATEGYKQMEPVVSPSIKEEIDRITKCGEEEISSISK